MRLFPFSALCLIAIVVVVGLLTIDHRAKIGSNVVVVYDSDQKRRSGYRRLSLIANVDTQEEEEEREGPAFIYGWVQRRDGIHQQYFLYIHTRRKNQHLVYKCIILKSFFQFVVNLIPRQSETAFRPSSPCLVCRHGGREKDLVIGRRKRERERTRRKRKKI